MRRLTTFLLLALPPALPMDACAQERSAAIGRWTGCFQLDSEAGRPACGVVVLDSLPACGRLSQATYQVPFDTLRLAGENSLPNQGPLAWRSLPSRQVEIVTPPAEAESPDGTPLCALTPAFFLASGALAGDSISGSWTWGEGTIRTVSGTFTLKRTP
jgi:hypothetical protein